MAVKLSIYGIGNFGYALLKHLDNINSKEIQIYAYDRKPHVTKQLRDNRKHPMFHKGVSISDKPVFVDSPKLLLEECDILILAVSSDATREVTEAIKPYIKANLVIVNTAKALDYQTGQRISSIVADNLTSESYAYGLLAGGTIARDLFEHEPLGADFACEDQATANYIASLLTSENLTVYPTTDLLGVEFAAAFKNIVAILAGITNGLGFSYGSETHIISTTAQLIADTCIAQYGAEATTFEMGRQSWGNDLWMSCTGNTRNREFGVLLGQGIAPEQAIEKMAKANKTVEGLNTVQILDKLEGVRTIEPIELLYNLIVEKNVTIQDFRNYLLSNKVMSRK